LPNNINSNLFFNSYKTQSKYAFEDKKTFKESLQEARQADLDSDSSAFIDEPINISNDNGKSSINYDFSSYSKKNSLADA
jgi:hypothetical protein